jgi:two-component system, LytTR family, response regulator
MKNYKCIIVEDEPLARNLLEAYLNKIGKLQLIKSFGNPLEALDFLRENQVDILFSDIQMPEVTGITLLKLLKNKPLIILTTAYSDYAIEGYELEVFDYLLKPISFDRFLKSVEKAINRLNESGGIPTLDIPKNESLEVTKDDFIFVKDGIKLIKINLNDILYIESLKDYVCIHTNNKKIVSLQTMKSLESTLPSSTFVRIHNSFIVRLAAIDEVEKERLVIARTTLPISDTYKKAFREQIEKKQIGG